jgi:protein translocase SEC61 complex gamma subunit
MKIEPHKKIKNFYNDSKRVLSTSYKPTNESFMKTFKMVILSIVLIGALGYVISLVIGLIA